MANAAMFGEHHLLDVYDAMQDAILVVDRASLRIRHTNRAAAQLTGYSASSLAQLTLPEIYGRVHRTGIVYLSTITDGQSICFEAQLLSAQNREISTETQITTCQLDENPCLICVIRNTSHRPAIERELRKRAAIYRSLVEAIPDLLFRIRRDGTYLEFKLPDNLGLRIPSDESEIIGRKIADVVPPHVTELAMPAIGRTLDTGVMQTIEYQIMEPSGLHDYEARFVAIEENEVMALVRDITERKQVDTLLHQKDRLLEGVAKATSRLMAPGDQDTAFNEALGLLGEAAGVDRVFILENHLDSATRVPTTIYRYEWVGLHVEPEMDILQDCGWQACRLDDWYHELAAGGIVNLPRQENGAKDDTVLQAISSLLMVPVFANGFFWGCIGFEDCHREHEWNAEEISTLRTMATSVGAAAERQEAEARLRLEREIADREREIADTLREVGMALTSTLELNKVLGRILEQARRVVPYDAANIFLFEDGVARIVRHAGYEVFGLTEQEVGQFRLRIDETPNIQQLLQSRAPLAVSDTKGQPSWLPIPGTEWIGSWLGAPIIVRDQVVGYFSFDVAQKDFYTDEHVRLVAPFAHQTAIAIENALLFENTQRLERVKSEMIRMASHDLRSPLTRIKETIRRFEEEPPDAADIPTADRHKYTMILEEAAHEMEQIIVNILSLERIEAQHQAAKSVEWSELVAASVANTQVELEAKQHQLSVECEPDLPVTRGDPIQLQRAMSNLISNAIKYTPSGGHIQIRVGRKSYGGSPTIAFEVTDDGIGIPPELQEQLFEPFYRAEQDGTQDIPGLGLGLSIVRAAIKYHKGNVYFDSVPGKGSMFGFWVPV